MTVRARSRIFRRRQSRYFRLFVTESEVIRRQVARACARVMKRGHSVLRISDAVLLNPFFDAAARRHRRRNVDDNYQ